MSVSIGVAVPRLRAFALIVVALGALTAAIGFLPGSERQIDRNDCWGHLKADLKTALTPHDAGDAPDTDADPDAPPHEHPPCKSDWQLDYVDDAGGLALLEYLAALLAPAALVVWRPRVRYGTLWFVASVAVTLGALVTVLEHFDLDWIFHTHRLWPKWTVDISIVALLIATVIVLPIWMLFRNNERPTVATPVVDSKVGL